MVRWKCVVAGFLFVIGIYSEIWANTPDLVSETPSNFKIAFIGDQGLGKDAEEVLRLIKSEGAQAVIHLGDFDHTNKPSAWESQINNILGADFPYFACVGNHDVEKWHGKYGYQAYLENRLKRLAISWDGDLGVKSSLRYKGIFVILAAPGLLGSEHSAYIKNQLAADKSIWRICGWHENMRLMQVDGKKDETGWGVYEEAREGGAIIATAHDHSYGRTYLMSNFEKQTIASQSDTLNIEEGKTFAFFSGLGGSSIYSQEISGPWWAKIYTSKQHATYGVLFGVFNRDGEPNKASFYFKNIHGEIVDRFNVVSNVRNSLTKKHD